MSYCTLYVTLSVSLTFSSFVFGSFNCNSYFMYVLLVIFQCHKKTRVQEKVGGDTNCLLYIPSGKEKKQQQKSWGTSGCGSFVVAFSQPAIFIILSTIRLPPGQATVSENWQADLQGDHRHCRCPSGVCAFTFAVLAVHRWQRVIRALCSHDSVFRWHYTGGSDPQLWWVSLPGWSWEVGWLVLWEWLGVNSFIPVSYLALLPLIPMFLCT